LQREMESMEVTLSSEAVHLICGSLIPGRLILSAQKDGGMTGSFLSTVSVASIRLDGSLCMIESTFIGPSSLQQNTTPHSWSLTGLLENGRPIERGEESNSLADACANDVVISIRHN
jgi:hypothetical protein